MAGWRLPAALPGRAWPTVMTFGVWFVIIIPGNHGDILVLQRHFSYDGDILVVALRGEPSVSGSPSLILGRTNGHVNGHMCIQS